MFGIVTEEFNEVTSFPKFGLNQNCKLVDVQFVSEQYEFVGVTIDVNGYEINKRYFAPERVFNNGVEVTDQSSPEYKLGLKKAMNELSSALNHIMGCVVGVEAWKIVVDKGFASFAEYGKKIHETFKRANKPIIVDVFLSYPWTANKVTGSKYLELPRSTKYGAFMCKSNGVIYDEDRSNGNLRYVNGEKLHEFIRNKWFMDSEFATAGKESVVVSTPNDSGEVLPF